MGWGWLEDLGDAIVDVGEAVVDTVEEVVDNVVEVAGAAAGAVVSTGSAIYEFGSDVAAPIWGMGEVLIDAARDPMGAAQALGEIISDPIGSVEGAFGAVIDHGLGLGGDLVDIAGSAASGVYGVGAAVVDSSLDTIGSAGGVIGGAVGSAAGLANAATGGYGEDLLNVIDDYVLDTVDYVTFGTVDVDYDNGALTAGIGVDDFLGVEVGVSGDGVTAGADAPLLGFEVGLTGSDGATLLLDENVPGVELPGGARVGLGIDDDGGVGVIAKVDDLRGITVGIAGDYDADVDLDQLPGSSARTATPGETNTTPDDVTGFDADVTGASESYEAAPYEPPAAEPEPLTDFAQDIIEVDQVESTTDDIWDDLG